MTKPISSLDTNGLSESTGGKGSLRRVLVASLRAFKLSNFFLFGDTAFGEESLSQGVSKKEKNHQQGYRKDVG